MNRILVALAHFVMRWCERHGRVLHITGTSPDDIYLVRYYIVRSQRFNVFLHVFLRSDKDTFHDHPWDFVTFLVRGSYLEVQPCKEHSTRCKQGLTDGTFRTTSQHRFVKRRAEQLHKVLLRDIYGREIRYTLADRFGEAPLTFFVSGRTRREWGFEENGRWIHWKKFLGLPETAESRG